MKKNIWIVVVFCLSNISGFSQNDAAGEKINRFIPFSIGDLVNTETDEINPVLTPDENTLFFSRLNHPDNHYGKKDSQDIWYSTKAEDGSWGEPTRLDAVFNNSRFNALFSITENGEYLVSGIYAKNGRYKKRGLSLVHYDSASEKFLIPEKVKVPKIHKKDKGLSSSAYMNKDGNILILSYTKQWQKANITKLRFSIKNEKGKWSSPKVMKDMESKKHFKSIENPYLSHDESTLYFSAYAIGNRNEYYNDIYSTKKLDDSYKKWSYPELLSSVINTSKWENYYKEFDRGYWAMFSSSAFGGNADIYLVKLEEEFPYIDLSGIVLLEGEPIKEPYDIVINGEVIDSVRIDATDSSQYAIHLPFGERYEIVAKAADYEAKIETIDATDQLEYLKVERDLQLSLLPFLDLTGVVTVNGDILKDAFELIINGQEVDSVYTDMATGAYSVKLPLGQVYEIYVKSGNYIPKTSFVDVSTETKQIQVKKNLEMTAIPYVDIYGQLINQKTNIAIDQAALPKFVLNGELADSIATETGNYKIRLPWGYKYTFQIQATDFDPVVANIDLRAVKNYQKIETNLYALPLELYATVTGRVLNKKTDLPIKESFFIDVDGSHSTSSIIDGNNSTFEIRLSLGKKSTLTASAKAYFPISEVIDLTAEEGNVKIIKDLYLVPLKVGETILLNNIFFETSRSGLKAESFTDINRVVDVMSLLPNLKIEIAGHTDSSGNDSFNLGLSNERAKSVAEYIIGQGISRDRVVFKGYGESKPIASNVSSAGRAQNRRVEFVVLEL